MLKSDQEARFIAKHAAEKMAEDVIILDMAQVSNICDYFVIVSATSHVRAKTIADHVEENMKMQVVRALHKEGYRESPWILIEFANVVLHIFETQARSHYHLEKLWGDAPRLSIS